MATEEPVSASMMLINDDLKRITGNPKATLSNAQVQILKDAMDGNNKHFMVVGPKGSGKTFLAAEIAKMKLKKSKSKVIVRLFGAEGTTDLKNHPSDLAIDFKQKYLNGFQLENMRNIWIREGAKQEQADFYEIKSKKSLQEWIISTLQKDEKTVMILDDAMLRYLEELGSLSELNNGSLIVCSANTEKMNQEIEQWRKNGWYVPSVKLLESFRYTPIIAEFLHHHGKDDVTSEDVSLPEKDKGCFYPQALPEFEHPVIWIEVKEKYDSEDRREILKKMKVLIEDKVPANKVLIILDRILEADAEDDKGRIVPGPTEGSEADIVIVDTDAYFVEDFSRARKQLFIITHGEDANLYTDAKKHLSEYYKTEGRLEVAETLPGIDLHNHLKAAWGSKSIFRDGQREDKRVMKVEVTPGELSDGSWWNKVKKVRKRKC